MILGTGRCGSTYIQTSLSATSDIWIWGEHDGFLQGLFTWANRVRNSKPMLSFSFPFVGEDPQITIRRDGTRAAWVSPFGVDDIIETERKIVIDLFNRRMPAGKKRWGFKEIRYGRISGVPERMFELFPAARCIHVVRNPKKSIISSICAWNSDTLLIASEQDRLRETVTGLVSSYMDRWIDTTSYLEDFCSDRPDATLTVQIETAAQRMPEIFDFLETRGEGVIEDYPSMFNVTSFDPKIVSVISDVYEEQMQTRPDLRETAARVGYVTNDP